MRKFFNFLSLLFLVDGCAIILMQSFGLWYIPILTPLNSLVNSEMNPSIFWFTKSAVEIYLGFYIYWKTSNK